jgi:RimJ/RimL family protein N-acetyltransferase
MKQIFESENISFVRVSENLVPDYLAMVNDIENVGRFIGKSRPPITAEQETKWVQKKLAKGAPLFSMLDRETGAFIGNIEFMDVTDGAGELGIAITASMQDKGFGTEAITAMVRYGMDQMGLTRIFLSVFPDNARAIHVYEKCGFREYDRTAEDVFMEVTKDGLKIVPYTAANVPDVLSFERRLREEEDFWGWEIDGAYVESVRASFKDPRFDNSISLLGYVDGSVAGRIDAVLIPSRFDGSVKAYLDWICVIKSQRHRGIAQALLAELKRVLKGRGIDTLIALTASNDEAQRFYRSIPGSEMHDTGIWICIK